MNAGAPAQQDVLRRLDQALQNYQRVTGRTGIAVLKQKAAQLIFGNSDPRFGAVFPGLVQLFAAETPREGEITAEAEARGFRLGRRDFGGELSPVAMARARARMGGFKSIVASVRREGGRLRLSGARLGVSGRRILGGRRGRGGFAAPGGLVNDTAENRALFPGFRRLPGEKRLNLRAVATLEEINLRESGRRYLSISFLHRRWRRLAASDPLRQRGEWRTLAIMNPRAQRQLIGELAVEGDDERGEAAAIRLTSFAPGALPVGRGRSLYDRAIGAVAADIETYLARQARRAALEDLRTLGLLGQPR